MVDSNLRQFKSIISKSTGPKARAILKEFSNIIHSVLTYCIRIQLITNLRINQFTKLISRCFARGIHAFDKDRVLSEIKSRNSWSLYSQVWYCALKRKKINLKDHRVFRTTWSIFKYFQDLPTSSYCALQILTSANDLNDISSVTEQYLSCFLIAWSCTTSLILIIFDHLT